MADNSAIEWTDATWNPITGCKVVSPGCTNCYAMRLAGTRLWRHKSRAGLTIRTKAGPVWTGEVRFNRDWLAQPLGWTRPRRIFVCAHGDLFAEAVPLEWIYDVFTIMAIARRHTFQVLTKRGARAREVLSDPSFLREIYARWRGFEAARPMPPGDAWPLPNVWLGVSIEDRARLGRLDDLKHTPAAVRFVSFEPLLGHLGPLELAGVDWAIVGGESGAGARPMHPDWARGIRDQCASAGVAFFFKQWGQWRPGDRVVDGIEAGIKMHNVGKTRAGRLLDGVEHNAFPA